MARGSTYELVYQGLKKYAVFGGRARRTEYWMFVLFNMIVAVVLAAAEGLLGGPGFLNTIYSLGVLIPSLAVSVRRQDRLVAPDRFDPPDWFHRAPNLLCEGQRPRR